jgi:hypothetical protein
MGKADALNIMHPFRTLPDTIDGVVCGRCGHPVWDHCAGETCTECESCDPGLACSHFALAGFDAAPETTLAAGNTPGSAT